MNLLCFGSSASPQSIPHYKQSKVFVSFIPKPLSAYQKHLSNEDGSPKVYDCSAIFSKRFRSIVV